MKEGYKKTELGWIPEEWQIKKLGDIFEFNGGMSISREKLVDEGVNYLHYGDIHKRNKNYIDVTVDKTWLPKIQDDFNSIKDTVKLTDGDVVFADASEDYEGIGKSVSILNKDNEEFVSGLHTIIAKDIYKSLDRQFKRFCFSTNDIRKQFRKLAVGTSVYGISKENIKKIYMPIPTLKEQEKISDILSIVDSQIDDTDKLIEKTKELKKGLMQRLLTKGIGHKEFMKSEVGEIPVEWDVKNLEDVCEFLDGMRKPIKASDRQNMQGNIPYYGASGIIDWVKDYIFDDELILLGEDGENIKSRNVPLAFRVSGKCWVNNHAHVLKCRENINSDFIMFVLENKDYSTYVIGSAQPKLNQAQCRKLPIQLPLIEEQNRIASILLSIDVQIKRYENKKSKLEELKNGLMQQLLTGKIRV